MTDKEKRVLSIQSTVVHGYAGGRSAIFPLQLHGFEVDAINTVQFSNHTGYGQWTGFKTTAEQVLELFEGLQKSEIDNFQYLLTGYLPSAATVSAVGEIGKKLKRKDPKIVWILDPVMGDDRELYVAPDVVPIYKSIIPYADIILPNQSEAEWLTDCTIDSLDSVALCLKELHRRYHVSHVVISSLRLDSHPDKILCCGSTATSSFQPRTFLIEAPYIRGTFVGTGDLFAALLLVWLHNNVDRLVPEDSVCGPDLPLARALERVVGTMQEVLRKSKEAMDRQLKEDGDLTGLPDREKLVKLMRAAELRLVQSQTSILTPRVDIKAVPFSTPCVTFRSSLN